MFTSHTFPVIDIAPEESVYKDNDGQNKKFKTLKESATKTLSVVVPAYNEEERCKLLPNF